MILLVIRAGDLLWREGDAAGQLVAIETGRVKIYRVLPNGNAVTLYLFGLRQAFDRIERSSVPEVLPRVAAALVTLVPEAAPAGQVLVIDLPVRSSEFAAAIGVAPGSERRAGLKGP